MSERWRPSEPWMVELGMKSRRRWRYCLELRCETTFNASIHDSASIALDNLTVYILSSPANASVLDVCKSHIINLCNTKELEYDAILFTGCAYSFSNVGTLFCRELSIARSVSEPASPLATISIEGNGVAYTAPLRCSRWQYS